MVYVDAYSEIDSTGLNPGEQPWLDLVFDLTECKFKGNRLFGPSSSKVASGTAVASTARGVIGFGFVTDPIGAWTRQDQDTYAISWGRVTLISLGERTNRLIKEMTSWFGLPAPPYASSQSVCCQAAILGGDASGFGTKPISMKLFFETSEGELKDTGADAEDPDYAELFLNIDLPNKRAWLKEKEPDYRAALVRWLSGRTVH